MVKVTVKRSHWFRGKGGFGSYLLSTNSQKMCCLGFAAIECGLSQEQIADHKSPLDIFLTVEKLPDSYSALVATGGVSLSPANSGVCNTLMMINDEEDIDDELREERLKENGLKAGFEFEFVD